MLQSLLNLTDLFVLLYSSCFRLLYLPPLIYSFSSTLAPANTYCLNYFTLNFSLKMGQRWSTQTFFKCGNPVCGCFVLFLPQLRSYTLFCHIDRHTVIDSSPHLSILSYVLGPRKCIVFIYFKELKAIPIHMHTCMWVCIHTHTNIQECVFLGDGETWVTLKWLIFKLPRALINL